MLKGHCQCGWIRYEAGDAVSLETACHCSICRRTSGAPLVAWFTVPLASLRFTSGTPTRYPSSEHGTRSFCPRCGTQLTFESTSYPDEIDITTCSLDDPERVPPRDHTRTSSRLSWLKLADGLPAFPEARQ
jgi:hypothetical protein